MRPLPPSAAASLVRSATTSTTVLTSSSRAIAAASASAPRALLSTTARRGAGAGHGPQYDPPTGWLFGEPPAADKPAVRRIVSINGVKVERDGTSATGPSFWGKGGWEALMLYGFGGSLLVFSVAYAFKPDTS